MLAFPEHKIEYALFEGIEQEGPFKGSPTLFVVGDVPESDTINALAAHPHLTQVYFGAGGRFDYSAATVSAIWEAYPELQVTVENPNIDVKLLGFSTLHWMCPVMWHGSTLAIGLTSLKKVPSNLATRVLVKIDTGYLTYVTPLSNFVVSDYQEYGEDKIIMQVEKK